MGRESNQAGPGSSEDLCQKRSTVPLQWKPSWKTLSLCVTAIKLTQLQCGELELNLHLQTQPLCSEPARESVRLLVFSLPQKDIRM